MYVRTRKEYGHAAIDFVISELQTTQCKLSYNGNCGEYPCLTGMSENTAMTNDLGNRH